MKSVLIVQNCSREGPGIIKILLKKYSIPFKIIDLEQGESFPPPKDYSALIVLGGPDSANDKNKKIQNALIRIRETLSLQIPYLGICLGLQLLVKAGGGAVVKNPVKEIGFRDPGKILFRVKLTPQGKNDPICEGLDPSFNIFQLHGETVQLTRNMTLLGTGEYCQNQIVKAKPHAYGIQGHLELTEQLLKAWMKEDSELASLSQPEVETDYYLLRKEIYKTGSKLLTNFLTSAGLTKMGPTN